MVFLGQGEDEPGDSVREGSLNQASRARPVRTQPVPYTSPSPTPLHLFHLVAVTSSTLLLCFLETLSLQTHSLYGHIDSSTFAVQLYLFSSGEWQPCRQGQRWSQDDSGESVFSSPPQANCCLFSLALFGHELDQTSTSAISSH